MNLLRHLYGIHSPTGNEWDMICFVKEYLKEHVPEAGVRMERLIVELPAEKKAKK